MSSMCAILYRDQVKSLSRPDISVLMFRRVSPGKSLAYSIGSKEGARGTPRVLSSAFPWLTKASINRQCVSICNCYYKFVFVDLALLRQETSKSFRPVLVEKPWKEKKKFFMIFIGL